MEPCIKLLLGYKKWMLEHKAKFYNLDTNGTKLDLATRIAKHEREQIERAWVTISNGRKRRTENAIN